MYSKNSRSSNLDERENPPREKDVLDKRENPPREKDVPDKRENPPRRMFQTSEKNLTEKTHSS